MDKTYWYDLWCADKDSIVCTMQRNMQADIKAGYDPDGACILRQRQELTDYMQDYNLRLAWLAEKVLEKGWQAVNAWCRIDMKRRGAIC